MLCNRFDQCANRVPVRSGIRHALPFGARVLHAPLKGCNVLHLVSILDQSARDDLAHQRAGYSAMTTAPHDFADFGECETQSLSGTHESNVFYSSQVEMPISIGAYRAGRIRPVRA